MDALAPWVAAYVGIPWEPRGRTREGADCYGLVYLVLNDLGHALPSFSEDYDDPFARENIARLINLHQPIIAGTIVEDPIPGDIVLMEHRGDLCHIGVYAGAGYILHTKKKAGALLDRLSSIDMTNKIVRYCRAD